MNVGAPGPRRRIDRDVGLVAIVAYRYMSRGRELAPVKLTDECARPVNGIRTRQGLLRRGRVEVRRAEPGPGRLRGG